MSTPDGEGRPFSSLWPWVAGCLALAGLSLLLPSTPTYDPFAWLGWGREITELDLDTRGGPAWKPLPVLFTTPFSLLGDAAPYLWLWIARAGGLLALVMAFRVARRLAGGPAGIAAGLFAALALALTSSPGLIRHTALGNSEGLLVALALVGFERHLAGERRHAFAAGVGAALLRPEAWPFVGLYGIYLWLVEPASRRLVAVLGALVPALWFLPELWGSGDLLRGSARAQAGDPGNPAFADQPALEILERSFESRAQRAGQLGALVAVGYAFWGSLRARRARVRARERDNAVLVLFAAALAWLAIVAILAEAGYAGDARYFVMTVAAGAILGGVGVARVAQGAAARLREPRVEIAGAVLLLLLSVPFVLPRVRDLPDVFDELQYDADLWDDARTAIDRTGGRKAVLRCGRPYTAPYEVQLLAWELELPSSRIGLEPRVPGTVFRTHIFRTPGSEPPPLEPGTDDPRFRPVAEVGEWRVLAACTPHPARPLRSGAASGG